jgi:hypothetical protein
MNRYVGPGFRERGAELPPTFEAFRAEAVAEGCDEVLVREWKPDAVVGTHVHPFDVQALLVRVEMRLTENSRTWHLTRGSTFRLAAGTPHEERYGEGRRDALGRTTAGPAGRVSSRRPWSRRHRSRAGG